MVLISPRTFTPRFPSCSRKISTWLLLEVNTFLQWIIESCKKPFHFYFLIMSSKVKSNITTYSYSELASLLLNNEQVRTCLYCKAYCRWIIQLPIWLAFISKIQREQPSWKSLCLPPIMKVSARRSPVKTRATLSTMYSCAITLIMNSIWMKNREGCQRACSFPVWRKSQKQVVYC